MLPKVLNLIQGETEYTRAIYTISCVNLGRHPELVAKLSGLRTSSNSDVWFIATNSPIKKGCKIAYLKLMMDSVNWDSLSDSADFPHNIRLLSKRICSEKRDWLVFPVPESPNVKVIEDWLRGMPSTMNMPAYNHEIDEWARDEGLPEIEDHDEYWTRCADALSDILRSDG